MKNEAVNYVATAISAVATVAQTNAVFQVAQVVITCLCALVTLAFSVWRWYKAAKADGKITTKEIDQGIKIIQEGTEKVSDALEKGKKEDDTNEEK